MPSTASAEDQLARAVAHWGGLPKGASRAEVQQAGARVAALNLVVTRCRERDAVQATRPEDCWCLGLGGRDPRWIDHETRAFETYCNCLDGDAARVNAAAGLQRRRAEVQQQRLARLFSGSGIPRRFANATLETFPVTPATEPVLERLNDWWTSRGLGEQGNSVLLYGSYGTGKTGVAIGLLKRWMLETGEPGLFVTVPALLDRIRNTYGAAGEATEHELLEAVKRVPFLVLDDLGAERVTDWVAERLFVLVNHRHDEDLATVFTSNLNPDQLAGHLGERTTWRVLEMSEIVRLEGPNLRDRLGEGAGR